MKKVSKNNNYIVIALMVLFSIYLYNTYLKKLKIKNKLKMKNLIKSFIGWVVITIALYLSCSLNSSTFDWFKWLETAKVIFGIFFTALTVICIVVSMVEEDKK